MIYYQLSYSRKDSSEASSAEVSVSLPTVNSPRGESFVEVGGLLERDVGGAGFTKC